MMNIKKLVTSRVFWSLIAMVSGACWCGPVPVGEPLGDSGNYPSNTPQPPQAKVICPMEWTSPTSSSEAGEMPPTGVVPFDWTDHPTAGGYEMILVTPNNSPVFYDTDGSEKELFLENYSQVGNYQVIVTALDANGLPLCSITMNFNMPVAFNNDKPNNNNNNNDDNEGEPSSDGGNPPSVFIIPSNPIVVPAPTEDIPK